MKFISDYMIEYDDDKIRLLNWSLNIFNSNNNEKSRIVWYMLHDMKLMTTYNIQINILNEFVNQIRELYNKRNNSFHNFDHGISVMHATYYLLKKINNHKFSPIINLGLLVAALCHDVDHTGKTNAFEINKESDLALTYHDKAVEYILLGIFNHIIRF